MEEKAEPINDKTKLEYMMQLSMQKQINETNVEILENKIKSMQVDLDQANSDREGLHAEKVQLRSEVQRLQNQNQHVSREKDNEVMKV